MNSRALALAALLLASCSRSERAADAVDDRTVVSDETAQPRRPPPAPPPHATEPTIDPKSTQAAEELVRSFVGLLNQRQLDQAYMLLGPTALPRPEFNQNFARYADLKVTAGAAGDQEGAAGSIYLSVPLTISGQLDGQRVSRSATAILRRVNDVPGSTEAQRRWHIERIEWNNPA